MPAGVMVGAFSALQCFGRQRMLLLSDLTDWGARMILDNRYVRRFA